MRLSAVIPTYNAAPLVVEAVESVLAQSRPADEIIVVDDGSTDDTAERLSRFGSPVRVIRQENGGVSRARNRGVSESTGELIAFLDADDVWHPRKLELQVPVLAARPEIGMLGARTYTWPAKAHPPLEGRADPVVVPLADLVVRNAFTASSVVARREVLRAVGEFDTNQSGTEDYDLWLRIAQRATTANLPVELTGYRSATTGSLSKNAARMESGMRLILEKLESAGAFDGKPLLRRKAWGYFRYSCAYMYQQGGQRWTAAERILRSLVGYPFSYSRKDVRFAFGRVRLLAASLLKPGRLPASVS